MTKIYNGQNFDGETIVAEKDNPRLGKQIDRVFAAMSDGKFHTLDELSAKTGAPQASVSARIRDLRKPKFGGFEIERHRLDNGVHEYRLS